MTTYDGRLELTWTNKALRLLAHEDGRYEWVSPSDYRVAEVRLLDDVATAGEVGRTRAANNLLIRGDALNALRSLTRLPEFAREYVGKVKLVYLDPPFNTQQSFLHYDDALEHSVWLTMMRDRLLQIRDLLAPDGSVWVHCDDTEQHRLRLVMDEVYGGSNYVATIVWRSSDNSNNDAKQFSTDHNYLKDHGTRSRSWAASDPQTGIGKETIRRGVLPCGFSFEYHSLMNVFTPTSPARMIVRHVRPSEDAIPAASAIMGA